MQYTNTAEDGQPPLSVPLLHSIHNTAKPNNKVALVPNKHYDNALMQLSAIHSILASNISSEYHDRVLVASLHAGIMGQQIDSVSSCNSAAYATALLHRYNPQDGEKMEPPTPVKRFRQIPFCYAAVTTTDSAVTAMDTSKETVSSITSEGLDHLFKKMKKHADGNSTTTGINIEDLEA